VYLQIVVRSTFRKSGAVHAFGSEDVADLSQIICKDPYIASHVHWKDGHASAWLALNVEWSFLGFRDEKDAPIHAKVAQQRF
jgi:hypothetical protein